MQQLWSGFTWLSGILEVSSTFLSQFVGIKGLRGPKSNSTATTMSTLDLHSTSKYNGKIPKSNSASKLTNSTNTTSLRN